MKLYDDTYGLKLADEAKIHEKPMFFFMVLSPDLGPKIAQNAPKIAARWPQDRPKSPQDGPKTAQDGSKMAQDGSKMAMIRYMI